MGGGIEGRAVLVTGGALGIGRGIVDACVAAGAAVAIGDINRTAAANAATEIAAGEQAGPRMIGTRADIGAAAVFLAKDAASFITGEYLTVDGGFMALGAWATGAGAER
jgi:NAD(P)-dependent dehydrogenase (short-subunit alcohol dehydrogenase family)